MWRPGNKHLHQPLQASGKRRAILLSVLSLGLGLFPALKRRLQVIWNSNLSGLQSCVPIRKAHSSFWIFLDQALYVHKCLPAAPIDKPHPRFWSLPGENEAQLSSCLSKDTQLTRGEGLKSRWSETRVFILIYLPNYCIALLPRTPKGILSALPMGGIRYTERPGAPQHGLSLSLHCCGGGRNLSCTDLMLCVVPRGPRWGLLGAARLHPQDSSLPLACNLHLGSLS